MSVDSEKPLNRRRKKSSRPESGREDRVV